MNETDINRSVREICKLAAAHQSGACLKDVKRKVNLIVNEVGSSAGRDWQQKKNAWTALLDALNNYASTTLDYRWIEVIRHARQRAKIRTYMPPKVARAMRKGSAGPGIG